MSLAKIETVKKARKDQGPCETCGREIKAGDPYKHYAVGFRGRKRCRCSTCPDPRPSERESSKMSAVYAAQEEYDEASVMTLADARQAVEDFTTAVEEVAQEYRDAGDAMGSAGEEMISKADDLDNVVSDLQNFDLPSAPEGYEPEDDEELREDYLDEVRAAVGAAINEAELP